MAQLAFTQLYFTFLSRQDALVHIAYVGMVSSPSYSPKYVHTLGRKVLTGTETDVVVLLTLPGQAGLWIPSIGLSHLP